MLNVDLKNFKKKHKNKINQIVFYSLETNGLNEKYDIDINQNTLERMKNYFK